jgi:hypothetical protein
MTIHNIKIVFFLLGFIGLHTSVLAQSSITVDASQQYSTFKFIDSQGESDRAYSGNFSGGYSVGYRHGGELGGLLIRAALGMRKAGATMVYDDTNYMWDLQYVDIRAGVGYMLLGERIQPYFTATPYFSRLLKANQVINNENFDLLKSGSLKKSDYGVFASPGVQITVSDAFSAYLEFNYMMGLQNLETTGDDQKSYNRAYTLTLGVSFNLTKK